VVLKGWDKISEFLGQTVSLSFPLAAILLLAFCAVAQQAPSVLRGSWIAAAGPNRVFPGVVVRSDSAGQQKRSSRFMGTFQREESDRFGRFLVSAEIGERLARQLVSPNTEGRVCLNGKTLEDMLKLAAEKQISGSWQSRRAQGNWWLQH
jgi:hypothetical protein